MLRIAQQRAATLLLCLRKASVASAATLSVQSRNHGFVLLKPIR